MPRHTRKPGSKQQRKRAIPKLMRGADCRDLQWFIGGTIGGAKEVRARSLEDAQARFAAGKGRTVKL